MVVYDHSHSLTTRWDVLSTTSISNASKTWIEYIIQSLCSSFSMLYFIYINFALLWKRLYATISTSPISLSFSPQIILLESKIKIGINISDCSDMWHVLFFGKDYATISTSPISLSFSPFFLSSVQSVGIIKIGISNSSKIVNFYVNR